MIARVVIFVTLVGGLASLVVVFDFFGVSDYSSLVDLLTAHFVLVCGFIGDAWACLVDGFLAINWGTLFVGLLLGGAIVIAGLRWGVLALIGRSEGSRLDPLVLRFLTWYQDDWMPKTIKTVTEARMKLGDHPAELSDQVITDMQPITELLRFILLRYDETDELALDHRTEVQSQIATAIINRKFSVDATLGKGGVRMPLSVTRIANWDNFLKVVAVSIMDSFGERRRRNSNFDFFAASADSKAAKHFFGIQVDMNSALAWAETIWPKQSSVEDLESLVAKRQFYPTHAKLAQEILDNPEGYFNRNPQ